MYLPNGPCDTWKTSDWGECSEKTCGIGTRERTVRCPLNEDFDESLGHCQGEKPPAVEECRGRQCEWYTDVYESKDETLRADHNMCKHRENTNHDSNTETSECMKLSKMTSWRLMNLIQYAK